MKKIYVYLMTLLLVLGLSVSGHATLIDMGDGTIYDTDLQLSWLKDANTNGLMFWSDAKTWANNLIFAGFDDWRLPSALNQDESGPCLGYNCTGSEMGHLFYSELGGNAGSSILTSVDPELVLFSNLQPYYYWSGTGYTSTGYAWHLNFHGGRQHVSHEGNPLYAIAVRPGQRSTSVPEPATLLLVGTGLLMLMGCGVFRKGY